ncbi:hypothetical protein BD410DRAFT_895959 [Rickenella mellea]|uniref:DUF7918 domain-containing protein n=1 Tax=Rickenella mellea TaxID=50990 RepID=A0A4Y7QEW4_9AGAM|nr:hypothetical protein BD410DRAFT_895959 [Rickenella mellea]
MVEHLGFSCWIKSNGEEVPTYQETTNENVKSAWIPSASGSTFSVCWQDKSKGEIATSGRVFIEGKDVASAIIRPGRLNPVERAGVKTKGHRIRPFKFSEIKLTDDDQIASQYDTSLQDIGTIKVEISHVRLGQEVPFKGYEAQDPGIAHERAKKAGAHCTTFEEPIRSNASRTIAVSTEAYDKNSPGPFLIFEFLYRSREMLQASGIMPKKRKKYAHPAPDNIVVAEIDPIRAAKSISIKGTNGDAVTTTKRRRVKVEEIGEPPRFPKRKSQHVTMEKGEFGGHKREDDDELDDDDDEQIDELVDDDDDGLPPPTSSPEISAHHTDDMDDDFD